MTVFTWARPRRFPALPPPEPRYFDVAADARVLAWCYWQSRPRATPTLLALHGLEGSSAAHYMQGLADKAFARGLNVVLLNQRNCGGTEALSATLYHSGLTDDPRFVLRELARRDGLETFAVVGYSLGGNLALKLAGETSKPALEVPGLRAACAVSPTMDLARCVHALERPSNWIYQWNFVRNLKARMRRKARLFPDRFDITALSTVQSVRMFDDLFTAPAFGYGTAERYYEQASSLRVVGDIAIPTLILSAANDPFVPPAQFDEPDVRRNPHIRTLVTDHGGHCGFVEARRPGYDGYWAEATAVDFLAQCCAASSPAAARTSPVEP